MHLFSIYYFQFIFYYLILDIITMNTFLNKFMFSSTTKYKVVFLRHGESVWNKANRFTGWVDVKLSTNGIKQAGEAGRVLKQNNFKFDIAYTSVLTRAIQTFNYAADEMDCHYIPLIKSWRLNQRHYGALQGLNKLETVEKHGQQQVKIWRRSFDQPPPPLDIADPKHAIFDPRYANVEKSLLPSTESLKETIQRVMPLWNGQIRDVIKSGKNLLIVAHGNSIRSIVKVLNNISNQDIVELNIPTAIPLVYEFDENLNVVKHYYLADPEELQKKIDSVKNQTKK